MRNQLCVNYLTVYIHVLFTGEQITGQWRVHFRMPNLRRVGFRGSLKDDALNPEVNLREDQIVIGVTEVEEVGMAVTS